MRAVHVLGVTAQSSQLAMLLSAHRDEHGGASAPRTAARGPALLARAARGTTDLRGKLTKALVGPTEAILVAPAPTRDPGVGLRAVQVEALVWPDVACGVART